MTRQVIELGSEIRNIPVGVLFVSDEETRKTVDQAALAELAKSIELQGVIEPLLVRPAKFGTFIGKAASFEIVAGQRRWLASKLASQKTCPCVVREMSDDEARELRIISNLQREDLPPMEEAEAYGKLLARPGATIETVAMALAKSPSYVGRRLKLLDAIEPVRAALKAGAIEVGHALELARLSERMQGELLAQLNIGGNSIGPNDVEDESGEPGTCRFCGCTEGNACAGGCSWANDEETICDSPKCLEQFRAEIGEEAESTFRKTFTSVAELRSRIERQSLRVLTEAPFPLDGNLPPMPCTDCPKRSTNAVLLFDDCAQDTCTDRRCYDAKVGAWIQAELASAKTEKRKLLKLTSNWSSDKDRIQVSEYSYGAAKVVTNEECAAAEEGIWLDGDSIGRRAMICRKADCKTHRGSNGSSSRSSSAGNGNGKPDPARTKLLAKVNAERKYRAALFAAIAKANLVPISFERLEALQLEIAIYAIGRGPGQYEKRAAAALGWPEGILGWSGGKKLRDKLASLKPAEWFRAALLLAHASELSVQEFSVGKAEQLEKLAGLVGVDLKKVRETSAAPAKSDKPSKPAAAAKPVKAKKTIFSAAARKRIADAQKKRWAKAAKKGGRK